MQNFEFYNPVKIIFGKDQLYKIRKYINANQRILIIYGGGSIKRNGVYEAVKAALADYKVTEFAGIEANPRYETCMKVVEQIKAEKVGFLLAVGGGSVIDATKFIALAALHTEGDPWEIVCGTARATQSLPFGSVLTLPATGSEMNSGSVITREEIHEKRAFGTPFSFPRFSFLLPDAAGTLPKQQVANGIVDAYIHVIEQYLTVPSGAPLSDRFAESILLTLIETAPAVYANPADYDAMSNLMWCATMALNGLIGTGTPSDWSVHTIGHELTALHGIDHARTLAIVLPGVWHVLKAEKREKLLQYAQRIWGISEGTDDERIEAAIEKTVAFFESVDIKTRLSDYNLGSETIDTIVTRLEKRGWTAFGDRGLVTLEKTRLILEDRL